MSSISRQTKPNIPAAAYYRNRVQTKLRQRPDWDSEGRTLREMHKTWLKKVLRGEWKPIKTGADTTFEACNALFSPYLRQMKLGGDIVQAITSIAPKARQLRVLDDGAGSGQILVKLASELKKRGIKMHSTALSYEVPKLLKAKLQRGYINKIESGLAEDYLPSQKYDVIISHLGSMHGTLYTEIFRKDHVLKFAYSLNKKGILMAAISISLSPRKAASIEKTFKKRGFRAGCFCLQGIDFVSGPLAILLIQRL